VPEASPSGVYRLSFRREVSSAVTTFALHRTSGPTRQTLSGKTTRSLLERKKFVITPELFGVAKPTEAYLRLSTPCARRVKGGFYARPVIPDSVGAGRLFTYVR
jgi:hypothetical protein